MKDIQGRSHQTTQPHELIHNLGPGTKGGMGEGRGKALAKGWEAPAFLNDLE